MSPGENCSEASGGVRVRKMDEDHLEVRNRKGRQKRTFLSSKGGRREVSNQLKMTLWKKVSPLAITVPAQCYKTCILSKVVGGKCKFSFIIFQLMTAFYSCSVRRSRNDMWDWAELLNDVLLIQKCAFWSASDHLWS